MALFYFIICSATGRGEEEDLVLTGWSQSTRAEPSVPCLTPPATVIVIVTATITTAASAQHLHLHCPDHFLLVFTVLAILYGFTYFILIILFDVSAFYRGEH